MKTFMLKSRMLCFLLFFLSSISFLQAQEVQIKGIVKDSKGEPIIGASVLVKGTTNGTITDFDGAFELSADNSSTISITYIGFVGKELKIPENKFLNVVLVEDTELLDEVVVVGYGTMKKTDLTGAVSSVSDKDFPQGSISSPEQLMQGKIAGIQITSQDGTPGAGMKIHIRGTNSIKSGNSPLYIVDGVPVGTGGESDSGFGGHNQVYTNPMNSINPNDIESISVLKDASAAAVYGARAANGVVLITTKKGKEGRFKVTYEGKAIVSTPSKYYDVLTADEFRQAMKDNNIEFADGGTSTNWQKEVMRTTVSQSHYMNFSGGMGNGSFMGSLGYNDNQGIIINSGMESLTGRLRITQKALNDYLNFDFNASMSSIAYSNVISGYRGVMYNALIYNPTMPVYDESGGYNEIDLELGEKRNPVSLANVDDNLRQKNYQLSLATDIKIIDELSARINFSYNGGGSTRQFYFPSSSPLGYSNNGLAAKRSTNNESLLLETLLNYNKTFADKHNVSAMVGYSWQNWKNDGFQVMMQDFLFDEISYDNLSGGNTWYEKPQSYRNENRLISYFGRFNYNYNDKYLATLTVRRDGSTRFGDNHKWGIFPSIALAWRISQEDFLSGFDKLSDLKFRIGYGEIGNQEIPSGLTQAMIAAIADTYPMDGNGSSVSAVQPTRSPNKDLKWETTGTLNVGLDFGFINNRINGSIEYYNKQTRDLLLEFPAPQPYLTSTIWANVGKVMNQGVELQLNGVLIEKKDFSWNLGFNIAYNKNEVVSLRSDVMSLGEIKHFYPLGLGFTGNTIGIIKEGESVNSFYGLRFAGIENGQEMYYTKDGGKTSVVSEAYTEVIGKADPDFMYNISTSFNYKNWDLSLFFRGVAGVDVINNTAFDLSRPSHLSTGTNILKEGLYTGESVGCSRTFSDRYLEDGSFLKLDNVVLGYSFNDIKSKFIKGGRVYVAAQNLFTITGYSGYDPEVSSQAQSFSKGYAVQGLDYVAYPRAMSFTFGLRLDF